MGKRCGGQIQFYQYLDEKGLDSLYAQCGEFIVESLKKVEKAGGLGGSVKAGLGRLLDTIGLGGLDVEGHLSASRLTSESFTSVFRVEQRIPLILQYLRTQKELCELSSEGLIREGYILLESEFVVPAFVCPPDEPLFALERSPSIALDAARLLAKPDGYVRFKTSGKWGTIVVGTSLAKYQVGLHHLVLMWKSREGGLSHVRLRVFGYIRNTGADEYYLKPFAMALAD